MVTVNMGCDTVAYGYLGVMNHFDRMTALVESLERHGRLWRHGLTSNHRLDAHLTLCKMDIARDRLQYVQRRADVANHDAYHAAFNECERLLATMLRAGPPAQLWAIDICRAMHSLGRLSDTDLASILRRRKAWDRLLHQMYALARIGYRYWPQWWSHPNNVVRDAIARAERFVVTGR